MLALLLLTLATGQLTNDVCWGATDVTSGVGQVGNNYATSPFPQSACIQNRDVFYRYTPTCTGTATISVASLSDSSLVIGVYTAGRSCGGLGSCKPSSSGVEASIDATVFGPTDVLYFAVGNSESQGAPTLFGFNITCQPANVAAGDICAQAIPITTGVAVNVSTVDASNDYQSGSSCMYPDIFLVYNATCDGNATAISLTDGSYNRVTSFYAGSCDQIVALDWGRECSTDSHTWPVRNGQIYYLAVGYSYDASYSVTITCAAQPRPTNDECSGAVSISTSSLVFDLTNATRSVPEQFCSPTQPQDVWYSYTATCTGKLVVQFNSTTQAQAFEGCYTQASGCSYAETFEFAVITGQQYRLVFGQSSDAAIEANFTCVPITRPSNDQCANGLNVTAPSSQVVDLALAITDSYAACAGELKNDAYLRYTTCAGTNTIAVENYNSSYVTLAAYLDCNLEPLTCRRVGGPGSTDSFNFDTPIALPVYLAVGLLTSGDIGGLVTVNFSCTVAPTTSAPTPVPTEPTTGVPSVAPTPAPTAAGNNSSAPTPDENNTDTSAPTLSGASSLQFSFGLIVLVVATQMQ